MTSRERFIRTMKGETVDRFFRWEPGPWPTTLEQWETQGFPDDGDFSTYFDMDPLRILWSVASGFTDSPVYPKFDEQTLEEDDTTRTYVDAFGVRKRELKEHPDTSMPQFLSYPVRTRADWGRMRQRFDPRDARGRLGDIGRLQEACADPAVPTMLLACGAYGHPRNLFGDVGLAYVICEDPCLLEEILDNWVEVYAELLRELTRFARLDVLLLWEDMCFKGGPLMSPDDFGRYMVPRYQTLTSVARSCGVEAIVVDTDGKCTSLIPAFLDGGVDCMSPFEVQADQDVVEVGRAFPSLAIMGGIDKRALVGDRAAIRREVDRVLPYFRERGGYVPALDHTVPPNVTMDSFRYYLECVRSYE